MCRQNNHIALKIPLKNKKESYTHHMGEKEKDLCLEQAKEGPVNRHENWVES